MSYKDFMNKIKYWDNLTAKWMMRNFYFMFFQIILIAIFLTWFISLFNVVDLNVMPSVNSVTIKALKNISSQSTIIAFLMILNSFWMLFMFNALLRMSNTLKDISFNISRLRFSNRPKHPPKG